MTNIDIERLRQWAKWREEDATHYQGCANSSDPWWHTGCAVLALIERLEKVEAQRDRLKRALEKISGAHAHYTCGQLLSHGGECDCHVKLARCELENKTDE